MDNETLKQEIDALIAELGEDTSVARPAEREVTEKIRQVLESTRAERTGAARAVWETYLPYVARRCDRLAHLEDGWDEDLDYFASENAQFWVDNAAALLERGDIAATQAALGQALPAARLAQRDRVAQVDVLLQALDLAYEINDRKTSLALYEAAEAIHRKHLAGGSQYAGSAWLPRIKKLGQKLARWHDQLSRAFRYAESVTVAIEADSEHDLQRVLDYLQQSLPGQVKVTRKPQPVNDLGDPLPGKCRARVKIKLEQ